MGNDLMPLTTEEITQILRLVEESPFGELHLEIGDFKLTLGKGEGRIPRQQTQPAAAAAAGPAEPRDGRRNPDAPQGHVPEKLEGPKPGVFDPAPNEKDGLAPVKAPTLGIFYRSPKPGAPPFTEVGKAVAENDTVCLLEVMKLFTAVKAGVKGRIVEICAKNNDLVQYGQVLFIIDPDSRENALQ
jgi:acetyl-CoA carboxylase biotin carboxyl carrier protein